MPRMKVECEACGRWHDFTPTALILIIQEFQSGDLLRNGPTGIHTLCLMKAFTVENVNRVQKQYRRGLIEAED